MAARLTEEQHASVKALVRRGRVTAESVVQAARAPDHPLHRLVGWHRSDGEVAAAYRLEQARLVLQCYQLRLEEEEQRRLSRGRDAAEQERLNGILQHLKENHARGLISYDDERHGEGPVYRDLSREYAMGKDAHVIAQLLRELGRFVGSRAVLHPDFHAHMLGVLEAATARFGSGGPAGAVA